MKALVLEGVNCDFVWKDVELPQPAANEVLVKIFAAALNHRDLWIQKGQYAGLKFPIILGSDGCGVVHKTGDNVSDEWIGKEVIVNPSIHWGASEHVQSGSYKILGLPDNGTFAEYVCVPAANIHPKPAHLTFEAAAALPLAGLTAYRALFSRAGLRSGDNVLITGAGGGVALFAIQFALAFGAKTFVTSGSDEKIAKAIQMGAKAGVNYRQDQWHKELASISDGGFDVIIDSAGGDSFSKLVDLAKPGGRIAFYGGTMGNINNLSPQKVFWKQLSILGSTMGSDNEFVAMLSFIEKHALQPVVDRVFGITDAGKAFERMAQKAQFGKIVLSFNPSTKAV